MSAHGGPSAQSDKQGSVCVGSGRGPSLRASQGLIWRLMIASLREFFLWTCTLLGLSELQKRSKTTQKSYVQGKSEKNHSKRARHTLLKMSWKAHCCKGSLNIPKLYYSGILFPGTVSWSICNFSLGTLSTFL